MSQLVQISESEKTTLNMNSQNGIQIANAGKIELILVNNIDNVGLDIFRFRLEKYNLFVISDTISSFGSFCVPFTKCLSHTEVEGNKVILSEDFLELSKTYPAIIVNPNIHHRLAGERQAASICKISNYQIIKNGIKFSYISAKTINQQFINENEALFKINASEQVNELDYEHWEQKQVNVFNLLGIEGEYERKEYN